MRLGYLKVFLYIAIILLAIELVLEFRAKDKGFSAYLLDTVFIENKHDSKQHNQFTYRGPKYEQKKMSTTLRIWMSSASYAEDYKRKINELFPNILCENLHKIEETCQMINAAKSGYSIEDNIRQLREQAVLWKPDYVILYSMNLDINHLSSRFLNPNYKNTDVKNTVDSQEKDIGFKEKIEEIVENTTIYGHLRRYLGGGIVLSTLLHDDIGEKAKNSFKATLIEFIRSSRDLGIKPVLVTFATKYNAKNYKTMPYDDSLFFVRYNEYLSSLGWVNTVKEFNSIIREISASENVPCIDLEPVISGNAKYFTDFVHFTKKGHKIMGEELAKGMVKILEMDSSHDI